MVLFGANGAGKSTLLAILATRYRMQEGVYQLDGLDANNEGEAIRARLIFVGHQTGLYGHLTPVENLRFFADLRSLERTDEQLREVVATVGLRRFVDRPVLGFSAGMRKRLALGRVLLAEPDLLLLDEPYSALDHQGIAWLNQVIGDYLQRGGMVILASHDPERVASLPHRPMLVANGKLQPMAA